MREHDLVIKNGRVVTAGDVFDADIGVRGGRVVAIAERLDGAEVIDAAGKLVMPGGIEGHCHIEQESASGLMSADDYYSGSVSAAFGGNTCIVPFAAQHKGMGVTETLDLYDSRAGPKAVIDYSYHLIVADPTDEALAELPSAFERGVTSFKVFTTYDKMKIDDGQFLDVLNVARRHGAVTMVHAEADAIVKHATAGLVEAGATAPRNHAAARPEIAEEAAIARAIALARYAEAPLFVVHVSTRAGADLIAAAQTAGHPIKAETCPQYLFFTADDLDRPGLEGAKFVCSPPLRDTATQAALWDHVAAGTFASVSSDHAPYRFDASGKLWAGPDASFTQLANGLPGMAMRLPALFSAGVTTGRLSASEFVALTATNAARTFGLYPRKGTIAVGSDADITVWDPKETRSVTLEDQHDAMDYTPYDGMRVTGWPTTVLSRGRPVIADGALRAKAGDGVFVRRDPSASAAAFGLRRGSAAP